MKTIQITNAKFITWAGIILAAICLAASLLWINTRPAPQMAVTKTVSIELDHKTYATLANLRDDSTDIVRGTVADQGIAKTESTGAQSVDGRQAPDIVKTDFTIRVDKSMKGNTREGSHITVVLTGGVVGDTRYVADDVPRINQGDSVIMYLRQGADGIYYPMAGGSALALKTAEGTFALPAGVSGGKIFEVSDSVF